MDNINLVSKQRDLEQGSQIGGIHWLVIFLSSLATIGAWYYSTTTLEQKNQVRFEREASQVINLIRDRMQLYESVLQSGVAYINSNEGDIDLASWQRFSDSIRIERTYPGINGIGVIYNIRPEELESFLEQQTKLRPDFEIRPPHNQPEYWPITYIEPVDINRQAVGLDIAFEATRYDGITRVRVTGEPQITGPFILVQDVKQTPGFLLYVPFYDSYGSVPEGENQGRLLGVTYAPFIMAKLMEGTLAKINRNVLVQIFDGSTRLYSDEQPGLGFAAKSADFDPEPLFKQSYATEMYGRTWDFRIETGLSFRESATSQQPLMILMVGIIIDIALIYLFVRITRAKRMALSYAEDMTENLQKKTDELKKAVRSAETANRLKSVFFASMSHDLRTPLNAIIGFSEAMDQKLFGEMKNKKYEEYVGLISRSSRYLLNIVNDILDVSALESGGRKLSFEELKLKDLISDCLEELGSMAETKGLTCSAQIDNEMPPILADKQAMKQIIINLVSNAIKFTPAGGTVTATAQYLDNNHVINVIDTGIGISKENLKTITSPFMKDKNDPSVNNQEGTGLGLSIVDSLVRLHGGTLDIRSEKNNGTTIQIIIPDQSRSVDIAAE